MSNIKSRLTKYALMAFSLCFVFTAVYAAQMTAEDKLNKGKMLYEEGKYDDAMDNFIDVFVQGNPEQISEANEYVNMIHFKRGGVEAPKKVPYDAELEKSRETGHEGKVLYDSRAGKQTDEYGEPVKEAKKPAVTSDGQGKAVSAVEEPTIYKPEGYEEEKPAEKIVAQSSMPAGDDAEVKAMRKDSINAQIAEMTDAVLAKLNSYKGINVYMRGGMVDAIDMESDVIFEDDGITFKRSAKEILDQVYSLMILSGTPSFVLLPPGSYSDNVSIQGVRQTVALNSYLINMGISSAKLNFNMGLTTEEPPAKFSDLEGISIVFDYTAKPNLKLKSTERNLPPVLSLGLYPFRTITPDEDEGMVVDFSVVQTSDKVADWTLQIIQHGKDGKYYVVRQVAGKGPIYRQIFWNGKKQYFGQILPLGSYTIILRATDVDGREKVVRRKVELLESAAQKEKAAKAAKQPASTDPKLDYTKKRLWTKPAAIRQSGADKLESAAAAAVSGEDFMMEQPAGMPMDDYGLSTYSTGDYANPASTDTSMGYNTGYNTVNMPGAAGTGYDTGAAAGGYGADLAGYGLTDGASTGTAAGAFDTGAMTNNAGGYGAAAGGYGANAAAANNTAGYDAMTGGYDANAAAFDSAAAVPDDAANYEY